MKIYLDYAATAPVRPEVREAIEPILFGSNREPGFGNASSIHWAGQRARKHLENARIRVAELFSRKPSEVSFTSGGTEADNLALSGVFGTDEARKQQLIISAVEHPAVIEPALRLERLGVTVTRVPVDAEGRLDLDALGQALARPTALVSIMAVNNETGVQSPIAEVIELAREAGARVHVDAVQSIGRIALPMEADMITVSGHKLGGIPGAGALIHRSDLDLRPMVLGGPQERGLRAGTESVAASMALAVALERAVESQDEENARLGPLRDRIEATIDGIEGARILGRASPRISSTSTAVFDGIEREALLQLLDLEGIAASSGSACASGSLEPSPVLLQMGVPPEQALSAVRLSLGWASTPADVDHLLERLPDLVKRARGA